jgi:hypothetical protein
MSDNSQSFVAAHASVALVQRSVDRVTIRVFIRRAAARQPGARYLAPEMMEESLFRAPGIIVDLWRYRKFGILADGTSRSGSFGSHAHQQERS